MRKFLYFLSIDRADDRWAECGGCPTLYGGFTADIIALRTFPMRAGLTSIFLASAKHHLIARFVLAKMGQVYTAAVDGGDYSLYPPSSLNLPKFSKKEGSK